MTPLLAAERRDAETMRAILSFDHMPTYAELAERLGLTARSAARDRVVWISRRANFSPEITERLKAFAERIGKPLDLVLCLAHHVRSETKPNGTGEIVNPASNDCPEPARPDPMLFGRPFPI
jgi:hypothetical protein